MKRSTTVLLSSLILLSSSAGFIIGQECNDNIHKPKITEEVKAYRTLVTMYDQAREPLSNEFKKCYLTNMNFLQENNPQIERVVKQYNNKLAEYTTDKTIAYGFMGLGLAGILISYALLLGTAKPEEKNNSFN